MRAKIVEDLLDVQCMSPDIRSSATTLYNGSAVSVSNNGIDTRDCDEINFIINAGTCNATVSCDIVESSTNNPSGATLVSGNTSPSDASGNATFTAITTANDNQIHVGSIKSKNFQRYMWLRYYQTALTARISAVAIKGKCDVDPQANAPVFDLNY